MSTPVFPEALNLQKRLRDVKIDLRYEGYLKGAGTVQEVIDFLEVVKRIDSFTTIDTTPNPSPVLPGFTE